MTFTVALTAEEEAKLLAQARAAGVSPDALVRNAVRKLLAHEPITAQQSKKPTRSMLGFLAQYGPAPSAEDIDQNRSEMFANFGRDDMA